MAASIDGVFEEILKSSILSARVLVVGAGGIGCELLKNLVLSGFEDVEIIDLDTIDVSNLNRQFLFHKQHVGKSKAAVARESALTFNPNASIKAYHDSITSSEYGVNFFKRFSLVMNALDNRAARNHVNRMCLAADVPLIESGTAGYDGQVELIKKGLTQCYECQPKAAQKTFPGCTIRNTPSEPIHCIVWAKHLFNQLFGEDDPDEDVSPDTADPEAAGDAGEDALKISTNENGNVQRVSTRNWAQSCKYDPQKLFHKLFHDDIKYLLSMDNLWKKRIPPTPLFWGNLPDAVAGSSRNEKESGLKDQKMWSIAECAQIFANSCRNLKNQFESLKEDDHLVWDKDDKNAMDFVASCANIRAHIFSIPQKTRFDIKSMAGNIIPAIATTNAIIAGIVVLHAFNVLKNNFESCQTAYLRPKPTHRNQLIVPEKFLNPPNPKCYVCSPKPEVTLCVDVNSMTVKDLEEQVLKKTLNMVAPDVILDGKGTVIISSEEGETSENNPKKLGELGIADGSILKVDDFLQNYELSVTIIQRLVPKDGPDFEVVADPSQLKPKDDDKVESSTANGEPDQDDDILQVVEEDDDSSQQFDSKKRKTDGETEGGISKKRRTEDVIVVI
ncbi:SUMO-activating enzyme subunit 2 [Cryptotermes secundus]|uniref:SUMO-activating enzyme subunit n=1 Tax=Cryptotermes secundus TaxID=105785 RepID=A0A2J7QGR2_9NEOP|nr:SUMO-activating enzyme subunit 2 [Cryptotermes secundus]XP_023713374.1 SUMO-activating enzyme subunit 2 [Cryptotermes secundus]PNF27775.1 SUMO-activating enzyme subunit 2 [Cryptotermes secundus]PNF27776.1 SUMO-activating enzyme subunit 2 [Cryptotermes secundus]